MKKYEVWMGVHLPMIRVVPIVAAVAASVLLPGVGVLAADEVITARIKATIERMDTAANSQNSDELFSNYSANFKSKDGLSLDATRKATVGLWAKLSEPAYQTDVTSVVPQAKGGVRVTSTTRVKAGYRNELSSKGQLTSTIESVSQFEEQKGNLKLVSQTVLNERTTISIGDKPPEVKFNIPTTVRAGSSFKVEAILPNSLEEVPALGGISLTPITGSNLALGAPPLQPLRAGGLFKTAQAPIRAEDQSVTLAFVRDGGMLLFNQRLRVSDAAKPASKE